MEFRVNFRFFTLRESDGILICDEILGVTIIIERLGIQWNLE